MPGYRRFHRDLTRLENPSSGPRVAAAQRDYGRKSGGTGGSSRISVMVTRRLAAT